MPQIIERAPVTVYTIDELSDAARAKALDAHRDIDVDTDWSDDTIELRCEMLAQYGFKDKIDIFFSGFWSQGDGASFTTETTFSDLLDAWRGWDNPLRGVDADFQVENQEKMPIDFEKYAVLHEADTDIRISFYRSSHMYAHYNTVSVRADFDPDLRMVNTNSSKLWTHDNLLLLCNEFIEELDAWRIEQCDTIYKDLESEYEHRTSDETILCYLRDYDILFLENGVRYED